MRPLAGLPNYCLETATCALTSTLCQPRKQSQREGRSAGDKSGAGRRALGSMSGASEIPSADSNDGALAPLEEEPQAAEDALQDEAEAEQLAAQLQALMREALRRVRMLEELRRQRRHMRRRFRLRQLKLTLELEQLQELSLRANLACRKDLLVLVARRNLMLAQAIGQQQQQQDGPSSPPPDESRTGNS
eukprot:jgi/Tetstr1/464867/TSEL_009605.t1